MNRKNLTAAVLAGLAGVVGIAGTAQAVNINPDGIGQVLLYPYYTTNGDNMTLLSVVNTTDEAKAVKVRFLESQNSVEVLDFNLYMSAYDVWTASIESQPDDRMDDSCDPNPNDAGFVYCTGPVLVVNLDENTCMVPKFAKIQSFLPFGYQAFGDFDGDGGSQSQDRMNEGHFEMIEMGVLGSEGGFDPAAMATHTMVDGEWLPADCDGLNDAWSSLGEGDELVQGEWVLDRELAIDPPEGGLFGGAGIINVWEGAMHTYEATAINGWSGSGFVSPGDSLHTDPGNLAPNLNSGDIFTGNVFGDQGQSLSYTFDGPMASVDAVSFLFMHDSLMNEYVTDVNLKATTEWVLTFPTKRFYVDTATSPDAPFTTAWAATTEGSLATACETVALTGLWDREERDEGIPGCEDTNTCETDKPPIVSPPPPFIPADPPEGIDPFQLCYEVNVIRFGAAGEDGADLPATTEILGKPLGEYLNFDNTDVFKDQSFKYGWARLELDEYLEDQDDSGDFEDDEYFSRASLGDLNGLPVLGFAVSRFSNDYLSNVAGDKVLSAYGALFNHRATRKVGSDAGGAID
jgi:hypothetical protein